MKSFDNMLPKLCSKNTQAIDDLEKRLNLAEAERRKIHDAPEPEMDKIRRAIKRVEARRAIIEEQLHAVNTLPDEHRCVEWGPFPYAIDD